MRTGKYIQQLLNDKEISLTKLANKIGLSSRNTLYRLFSGYHSYEKQKELIDKIVENVDFTEDEISKIYEMLEQYKVGGFVIEANEVLFNIYNHAADDFPRNKSKEKLSFDLNKCLDRGKTVIIMSGIVKAEIIFDIYKLLKKGGKNIKVYNYIYFPVKNILAVYELLAVLRLSEFENYIPIQMEKNKGDIVPELRILSKNSYGSYMQILECINGESMFLETSITNKMYEYEIEKHRNIQNKCIPLKFCINRVPDYIKILNDVIELDSNSGFFSEGAPCFGYLPLNILYEMFESINFFGFPKEHPYVEKLITLVKDREKIRCTTKGKKRMLFEVSTLSKMMLTGFSVDHAIEFPPMTIEQRREYFENLIKFAKEEPKRLQIRILKNGFMNCSYVYVEDRMLYIYRSKTGYTDGSVIMLKEKGVNDIMKSFTTYVWEKCTLPDDESIALIEKMAKEYLYK